MADDSAKRTPRRALCAAIASAALLAACRSAPPPAPPPPPPKPIDVAISIVAAPDLNPNRNGRPSPVFLRVYQLRNASKFLNADFDDLSMRADATLAATLIGRDERMVEPATTTDLALKIDPETQLLGVIAEYSDLANSQWRGASPAPGGGLLSLFKNRSLVIKLDRQAVSVVAAPAKGT
jgi:type VI secretion system protein VasD